MPDDHEFFRRLIENKQHRPSARAIIFDNSRQRILVEMNSDAREKYVNFPGGGIKLGETIEECLHREMIEELDAKITHFEYLFLVENFITFQGEVIHGIEHYCKVEFEREDIVSQMAGFEFPWIAISDLIETDLRPAIVRDRIVDGTYHDTRHLISRNIAL